MFIREDSNQKLLDRLLEGLWRYSSMLFASFAALFCLLYAPQVQAQSQPILVSNSNVYRCDFQSTQCTYLNIGGATYGGARGPDGSLYIIGRSSNDSTLYFVNKYDSQTGAFINTFIPNLGGSASQGETSNLLKFGPNGNIYVLLVAQNGTFIRQFDINTGAAVLGATGSISLGANTIRDFVFGPGGDIYITDTSAGQVKRYSTSTGQFVSTIVPAVSSPWSLAFSADGSLFVSSTSSGSVFRYNGTTGAFLGVFFTLGNVREVAIAPNGNILASDTSSSIKEYNGATGVFVRTVFSSSYVYYFGLYGPSGTAFQGGLSYASVNPCRIADTRNVGGALSAGAVRSFLVNSGGTAYNYSSQGGSSTGCGIPTDAKAIFFNIVAVSPTGPGFLRAWPYGTTLPTASILNFASYPGLNVANGVAIPVCDPAVNICSLDLNVQVDQANAQVVIDVLGYYK